MIWIRRSSAIRARAGMGMISTWDGQSSIRRGQIGGDG
jgi:hypothetical protein